MLTAQEKQSIKRFDSRFVMVRDRTRGCAEGWQTGFYLWGEGGIGKSWAVLDELSKLRAKYKETNSRLTGKGLFELLQDYPDYVHVIEDMEGLFKSPNAAGVLRSALWTNDADVTQQHKRRLVTWRVANDKREFIFTGSIILIMNQALDDLPALRAVKTRIAHLHLQPTQDEIRAKMKWIASRGYRHGKGVLTPGQCLEVYEHVVKSMGGLAKHYDLRMLIGGFQDRLQYEAGQSEHSWQDLINSRTKERVVLPSGRHTQMEDEFRIAQEINALRATQAEKVAMWKERTGGSKSTFYRRLERA